jgi:dienelactone hydrolase
MTREINQIAAEAVLILKARRLPTGAAAVAMVIVFLVGCAMAASARAQDIVVTEMRIPTHGSGKKGLEAVMVRPNDGAPHPLALITHGTPRGQQERAELTPLALIPQGREFARRGWTAVVVLRRGFGDSGGGYAEEPHACSQFADYAGPAREAVKDLRAAADYLLTLPEVDPSRMISVGHSAGGFAVVGLAADPPTGLVAAISFAPGRGSQAGQVCNPDLLLREFAQFGQHAKVPMLWIYAANDHVFAPQFAREFYRTYTEGGGKATFVITGPFGQEGHELFSLDGIPMWAPIVDAFLKSQNLVLRDTPLRVPLPALDPPANLSGGGLGSVSNLPVERTPQGLCGFSGRERGAERRPSHHTGIREVRARKMQEARAEEQRV